MIRDGGSAWESNPPGTVLAPHTGFEVREPHQPAAHFLLETDGDGVASEETLIIYSQYFLSTFNHYNKRCDDCLF